jgi:hypothetical protein
MNDKLSTNFVAFSPQAHYTDRAAAIFWLNYCNLLPVYEYRVVSATGPTAINLGFLDRNQYFFIHVSPQLSS